MNVVNQPIVKRKMGLLNLAQELGSVSQACDVPIDQFSRTERARLDSERELLALMSQHADQFRQINDARQQKSGSDTSLLALASRTAADHGPSIYRSEPDPNGELTLWLSGVEFNQLLTWLDQLASQD